MIEPQERASDERGCAKVSSLRWYSANYELARLEDLPTALHDRTKTLRDAWSLRLRSMCSAIASRIALLGRPPRAYAEFAHEFASPSGRRQITAETAAAIKVSKSRAPREW